MLGHRGMVCRAHYSWADCEAQNVVATLGHKIALAVRDAGLR